MRIQRTVLSHHQRALGLKHIVLLLQLGNSHIRSVHRCNLDQLSLIFIRENTGLHLGPTGRVTNIFEGIEARRVVGGTVIPNLSQLILHIVIPIQLEQIGVHHNIVACTQRCRHNLFGCLYTQLGITITRCISGQHGQLAYKIHQRILGHIAITTYHSECIVHQIDTCIG